MEKKYYIIPTIKVKEIEVESLMAGESLEWYKKTEGGPKIGDEEGDEVLSKPMTSDFNVWDK